MSNRDLNGDHQIIYTSEELQRRLADDKRAETNLKNRKAETHAAQRIGYETTAYRAGKKSANGERIERIPRRTRDLFAMLGLRGSALAAWNVLFKDLSRAAIPVAAIGNMLSKHMNDPTHSVAHPYCYDDPSLLYDFTEIDVPIAVKERLINEIEQLQAAQWIVNDRFDTSGFMGPFPEEKQVFDLKNKFAIRTHPETGQCAHCADRVDALVQKELERAPHGPTDRHNVFVYYCHTRNPDGSRGQKVRISHSLNDEGEIVKSDAEQRHDMKQAPVPAPAPTFDLK